jgi:hypothetical protein
MDGGLKCHGNPQLKKIQEHFVIFGSGELFPVGLGSGLRVLLLFLHLTLVSLHACMHVRGTPAAKVSHGHQLKVGRVPKQVYIADYANDDGPMSP